MKDLFVIVDKEIDENILDYFNVIYVGKKAEQLDKLKLNNNQYLDLDGENIHDKYNLFGKLCGIYYVYKNLDKFPNINYFGFQINNLLFNFNDDKKYLYSEKQNVIDLKQETDVNDFNFANVDCVLQYPKRVRNVYSHFVKYYNIENIGVMLSIIRESSEEEFKLAREYINSKIWFEEPMFILNKEDFIDFCEYVFPKLFEFERRYINSFEETKKDKYKLKDINIFKFLFGFYFYSLIQLDKNISYLPLIKINGKKDKIKVAFKNMDLDNRSMVRNLTIIPLVDLLPYNVRKIIRYRKNDIDKIIKKR